MVVLWKLNNCIQNHFDVNREKCGASQYKVDYWEVVTSKKWYVLLNIYHVHWSQYSETAFFLFSEDAKGELESAV